MEPNVVAPGRDEPRQVATNSETDYTLSLEEASNLYAKAGHPRTLRSLQRYCKNKHLDAQPLATATGDKYLVTPQSVARHIAQIEELAALSAATGRDLPRHVATAVATEQSTADHAAQATGDDSQRQGLADADSSLRVPELGTVVSRYVERLEREVEQAKDDRDFLREQIDRKDRTIDSLIERDRETNILVRGLQEMLTPLLNPRRERIADEERPRAS